MAEREPSVTITPAAPEQLAALTQLLALSGLPTAGFPEDTPIIFAAQDGGAVAGCAALEIHDTYALLRSVAAAEPGQGIGTRLVEAVLDEARNRGLRAVYLLTETAAAFFLRFGFTAVERNAVPEIVHRSVEFTTACPESALAMRLDLNNG